MKKAPSAGAFFKIFLSPLENTLFMYPLKAGWNCIADTDSYRYFGGEKMPINKAFGAAEEDFGSTFTMPF